MGYIGTSMPDDIGNLLTLFVQCNLHTILRVRNLYPQSSFQRRRVFLHLCWWCTCFEVEEYVSELCASLRPAIARNRVRRVVVPISDEKGVFERYIIDFLNDPQHFSKFGQKEIEDAFGLALKKLEVSSMFSTSDVAG